MLQQNKWCLILEALQEIPNIKLKIIFNNEFVANTFIDFYRYLATVKNIKISHQILENIQLSLFSDLCIIKVKNTNALKQIKSLIITHVMYYCIENIIINLNDNEKNNNEKDIFYIDHDMLSRIISRYYAVYDYHNITKFSNFYQFLLGNAIDLLPSTPTTSNSTIPMIWEITNRTITNFSLSTIDVIIFVQSMMIAEHIAKISAICSAIIKHMLLMIKSNINHGQKILICNSIIKMYQLTN